MFVRTGVDIVEIERLDRIQPRILIRFIQRVYTPLEVTEANQNKASLAGKFAAKEAVSKVLGTGIGVISWKEIEIKHNSQRMPVVNLTGKASEIARQLGLVSWSVSISHSVQYAVAVVVALGE